MKIENEEEEDAAALEEVKANEAKGNDGSSEKSGSA